MSQSDARTKCYLYNVYKQSATTVYKVKNVSIGSNEVQPIAWMCCETNPWVATNWCFSSYNGSFMLNGWLNVSGGITPGTIVVGPGCSSLTSSKICGVFANTCSIAAYNSYNWSTSGGWGGITKWCVLANSQWTERCSSGNIRWMYGKLICSQAQNGSNVVYSNSFTRNFTSTSNQGTNGTSIGNNEFINFAGLI